MLRRILAVAALCLVPVLPAAAVTIEPVTSPGGVTAWLVEDHTNPIIALHLSVRGGAALDPADKTGLTEMVASLLDEGAGDLDSQAFHKTLETLSISFGYRASEDGLSGHLKTITANRDKAFDLLRQSLTAPRFDTDAVERIRSQILADLTQELQNPNVIAERAFAKALYPDHPYGRPVEGTEETIKAITVADLKDWVARHLGRDRLAISVVGDISPEQLAPLLDRTFGGLPAATEPVAVADVAPVADGKTTVIQRKIPQSVVLFGAPGLSRRDPDWYAAYVMNHILGGGSFSSRLMTEVRVKRGLAYGVYTYLVPHDHSALLEGSVATRNERVSDSIALIKAEWRRLAEGGVTPAELSEAKTYLNGSFPLQLDGTESIAGLMDVLQTERLGIDYLDRRKGLIDAVTREDIARVARRLLDPDHLTFVVLGDPKGL